jgi:hypothetical protein
MLPIDPECLTDDEVESLQVWEAIGAVDSEGVLKHTYTLLQWGVYLRSAWDYQEVSDDFLRLSFTALGGRRSPDGGLACTWARFKSGPGRKVVLASEQFLHLNPKGAERLDEQVLDEFIERSGGGFKGAARNWLSMLSGSDGDRGGGLRFDDFVPQYEVASAFPLFLRLDRHKVGRVEAEDFQFAFRHRAHFRIMEAAFKLLDQGDKGFLLPSDVVQGRNVVKAIYLWIDIADCTETILTPASVDRLFDLFGFVDFEGAERKAFNNLVGRLQFKDFEGFVNTPEYHRARIDNLRSVSRGRRIAEAVAPYDKGKALAAYLGTLRRVSSTGSEDFRFSQQSGPGAEQWTECV